MKAGHTKIQGRRIYLKVTSCKGAVCKTVSKSSRKGEVSLILTAKVFYMGLKILVADDEADITDTMARKIAAEGYDVIKAYDGQAAWDRIVAEHPDIVLLDVNMPYKDGFTILRELRASPPTGQWLPVIIVSARQELDDIKRGMDLDADHYLTKPCAMADVIKAIRLMAQLRRQRRSASD